MADKGDLGKQLAAFLTAMAKAINEAAFRSHQLFDVLSLLACA
jgi:hypothetical protein